MLNRILSISILAILLCTSCTRDFDRPDLHKDPYLVKYFSGPEIDELDKIIAFTDSCVMTSTGLFDPNVAYNSYLDSINEAFQSISDLNQFDHEVKRKFLSQLNPELVSNIWNFYTPRFISDKNHKIWDPIGLELIDINFRGTYAEMLEEVATKYDFFTLISEQLQGVGGVSPAIASGMFGGLYDLNFDDTQMRLWTAIFLISMEEPISDRIDKYLGSKYTVDSDFGNVPNTISIQELDSLIEILKLKKLLDFTAFDQEISKAVSLLEQKLSEKGISTSGLLISEYYKENDSIFNFRIDHVDAYIYHYNWNKMDPQSPPITGNITGHEGLYTLDILNEDLTIIYSQ